MTKPMQGGAGKAAPKSLTSHATPTPEAQPRVASDADLKILAQRVRDGAPLSQAQRDAVRGAGSRRDAPEGLAADLGLAGFADFRSLAQAALEADADRARLIGQAIALVKEEAARPDDVAFFVDRLRNLRGTVPAALAAALDLSPTASFGTVADALADIMSPKRGGVR